MAVDCVAGLKVAAYDYTRMTRTEDFASDTYTFYKSNKFREYVRSQSEGFSITIPLPDDLPPAKFNHDSTDDQYDEFSERVKRITKEKFSKSFCLAMASQLVSAEAQKSYRDCIKQPSNTDIGGITTANGNYVTVTIRFVRKYEGDSLPIVRSVWAEPLTPVIAQGQTRPEIRPGVVVPDGGISQRYFGRNPPGKENITISTTRGVYSFDLDDLEAGDIVLGMSRELTVWYEMSQHAGDPQEKFGPFEVTVSRGETRYFPGPSEDDTFGADQMQARVAVDDEGRFEVATRSINTGYAWRAGSALKKGSASASSSWCHIRADSRDT